MKYFIFLLIMIFAKNMQAQFVNVRRIKPCPNSEDAIFGYPSIEYFKHFGKAYTEHYKFENPDDSLKFDYFESRFSLKNNLIRVKTISSEYLFPKHKKYKINNGELTECNRFGKPVKNKYTDKTISQVIGSDSICSHWNYFIRNNNDTVISKSYRDTYNSSRQLVKWEVAWDFFAFNDSTWFLAETSSSWGGVQRVKYEYITNDEINMTLERITNNSNTTEYSTIKYKYDSSGKLIEIAELRKERKEIFYYRFSYKNDICVLSELYKSNKLIQSAEILVK